MGNRGRRRSDKSPEKPRRYLPEEILREILARFEEIDTVRLLNKHWNAVSSSQDFRAEWSRHSKPSVLIQARRTRFSDRFRAQRVEFESQDLEPKPKPFLDLKKGELARSTCEGLILVADNREGRLFVMNTATKRSVSLPKCPSGCLHKRCGMSLGFCPDEKIFKVVHVYTDSYGFEILTLGCPKNEWRVIPGPFEDNIPPFNRLQFSWEDPLATDSHARLHWSVDSNEFMVSMDVQNETYGRTLMPSWYNKEMDSVLEMGDRLGVVRRATGTRFDVAVVRARQRWEPLYSIDASELSVSESHPSPTFESLRPIFALRDGHVLIFVRSNSSWLYRYDDSLGKMEKFFRLEKRKAEEVKLLLCKNSLLDWNDGHRKQLVIKDSSNSDTDFGFDFEPKTNSANWNLLSELTD